MSDDQKESGEEPVAPEQAPGEARAKTGGNSLQDASDEMVRFMEQDDEPGHVGRGDGG